MRRSTNLWQDAHLQIEKFKFTRILSESNDSYYYSLYKRKNKQYAVYYFQCKSAHEIKFA